MSKLKWKHESGRPVAITEVEWFEHVPKGEKPRCYKGAMGNEDVQPEAFELALRSAVAALCSAVGAEQEKGVEVVPDAAIN